MKPGPQHKATTRELLEEAALSVFVERGFARATTREIAHRAGVSEGTMYRHFRDKQELFFEVFRSLTLQTGETLRQLPSLAGQGTVRENLEYLFSLLGNVVGRLSSLMASIWADPDLAAGLESRMGDNMPLAVERPEPVAMAAKYVRAEQALGRIRADIDPTQAGAMIVAIPFASSMEQALRANFAVQGQGSDPTDFPAPAATALDILVKGLTP